MESQKVGSNVDDFESALDSIENLRTFALLLDPEAPDGDSTSGEKMRDGLQRLLKREADILETHLEAMRTALQNAPRPKPSASTPPSPASEEAPDPA